MVGIISYGAYIPWHRLERGLFQKAWGGFAIPGEKAVAYYDEDSVTMAVAAARDCLEGFDRGKIDGHYFASTTAPYKERQCSAIVAMPLDLRSDIRTADINTSLRSGTTAMALARDSIAAGSAENILVTAADMRLAAPSGMLEQRLGDGAAAFLLGTDHVIADILDSYSCSDEFSGTWRGPDDVFVRSWEDRMVQDTSYTPILTHALETVMKRNRLLPKDFSKVVFDSPGDPRGHAKLAASLGFKPSQVQNPLTLFMTVGFTGCASAAMLLVSALEEAKAGEKILFAGSGNGTDVFVLRITDAIEKLGQRRGIKNHLDSKKMLENYNSYLKWRDLVPLEAARRPDPQPIKVSAVWRERKVLLGLWGIKCRQCGTPQYDNGALTTSPIRICGKCQAQDDFDDYNFSERKATVFSFTNDGLAPSLDPPASVVLVEFEGGGRAFFDLTDRVAEEVEIGMEIEMTFRKICHQKGISNYFWKARPLR